MVPVSDAHTCSKSSSVHPPLMKHSMSRALIRPLFMNPTCHHMMDILQCFEFNAKFELQPSSSMGRTEDRPPPFALWWTTSGHSLVFQCLADKDLLWPEFCWALSFQRVIFWLHSQYGILKFLLVSQHIIATLFFLVLGRFSFTFYWFSF